ncbi:GGDEF domain-containing response regulator [Kaarinaea lacus]
MADSTDNQAPEKPRILIVDDSRLVRIKLTNVLQDEFSIDEAEDGEDGWETLLADDKIQVVLTDAGMPNLDGWGFIERIRAHGDMRIKNIPIIMITAAEDEESRQKALGIGATDFVTKPFDKAQLIARVRTHARLDQTSRDLAEHATDDQLTGVRSRRYFLERGKQDIAFTTRHNQDLSIIVVGLDHYESIKANVDGNLVNKVLGEVATILKDCIRTEDTLARTSDSHFSIIAPTLGSDEAELVCDRIHRKLSASPLNNESADLSLKSSIGVVNLAVDKLETIEDSLTLAEQYVAKAQAAGGNSIMATEKKEKPKKRVSLDASARILELGDPERLVPYLRTIAAQIIPLLEFCNTKLSLGVDEHIQAIKEKLKADS